ncbi:Hypothetical protein A7982_00110 [Minicystis rosea]|nr:Hypothetical protein A7982_00110 [Minicystis rosea]
MIRRLRILSMAALVLASACHGTEDDDSVPHFPAGYSLALTGPKAPFSGPATIKATPSPADGTLEVSFSIDGEQQDVDLTAPYAMTLDLSQQWGGTRHVTAIARRADGAKAEASLDITYDPLGPFVTVLSPAVGTRVPPEGGVIDAAFVANDPHGLAEGAIRLDEEAPIPIPLTSLSLSIPVSAMTSLPATRALSWSFTDTIGNRTEGTISLTQTHEELDIPIADALAAFSLPGGGLSIMTSTTIRTTAPNGTISWIRGTDDTSVYNRAFATTGGDVVALTGEIVAPSALRKLRRFRADGAVAWEWPDWPDRRLTTATYVPATDALLVAEHKGNTSSGETFLLDATGQEKWLTPVEASTGVALVTTPPGAALAGIAVVRANWSNSPAEPQLEVFDAQGTPAWSATLPTDTYPDALLSRDALLVRDIVTNGNEQYIVGPGGIVAALTINGNVAFAPNGDLIAAGLFPAPPETISRVRPDGSIVWQVALDEPLTGLTAVGDRVGVSTLSQVWVIDAQGNPIAWTLGPHDDLYVPTAPRLTLMPSGAFYVVDSVDGNRVRVHSAGPDGVTRWRETFDGFPGPGLPFQQASDDERGIVFVSDPALHLRVFSP